MSDDPREKLKSCLLNLDKNGLLQAVQAVVAEANPEAAQDAVDALAEGLQIVGRRFQEGEWFLGELVYTGEVAKEAMGQLSPLLKSSGAESKGTVVIGTVAGDLHDLGKNIFGNYAASAGFEIVDLGVGVAVEDFARAAREHQPVALGMSCLLTVCAGSVGKVIEELSRQGLREALKVIIGGAALTEEFAKDVGADAFAPDAVTGTDIIRAWSCE
ncbi:MAG: cobalamin-dependent protein [Deltaproteobacteria bacterium]|nr:cobalamin-dependent protein [Deltaproteobacteria bacterium]MBW2223007.1 cobalamin-dependent protein [Deltaproteobacteria bacterium]MBW2403067.1 cobalamin-dependent protein [Deltaproteobacteria bacterium]